MGFFKTYSEKELKRIEPLKQKILSLEPKYEKMDDDELRGQTAILKGRLSKGETLDDILTDAFAVCREAMYRVIAIKPYPVQLIGGIVLHQGRIAEMKTGEGKTFVAALPAYLNALSGKGVHVITVNDYLARYGKELIGKVFSFLGMSVGLVVHGEQSDDRRISYASDITYGTNNEFGFDYLRDNMCVEKGQRVQRGHSFAIVDEVDSILIDEARTPLIISGEGDKPTDLYDKADRLAKRLKATKVVELDSKVEHDEYEGDYIVDEKAKTATLLPAGVKKAETHFGIENLMDPDNITILHHINQAIRAHGIMENDVDYVVKDGEIIIVDEHTGRLMLGRRFNEGLHQAIEAKEHVNIKNESKTIATITLQNYFRLYDKLSGMTGTAMTEETEFRSIYRLDVVEIPQNKPCIRIDHNDCVYKNERGKFKSVVSLIEEKYKKGQPVLVGTISIEKSEHLSRLLKKKGIRHQVLNAIHHKSEAEIVAQAGKLGSVTIATNMAGRGTDIMLGGNAEFLTRKEMQSMHFDDETIGRSITFSETARAHINSEGGLEQFHNKILSAQEEYLSLVEKYKGENRESGDNSKSPHDKAIETLTEKGYEENVITEMVNLVEFSRTQAETYRAQLVYEQVLAVCKRELLKISDKCEKHLIDYRKRNWGNRDDDTIETFFDAQQRFERGLNEYAAANWGAISAGDQQAVYEMNISAQNALREDGYDDEAIREATQLTVFIKDMITTLQKVKTPTKIINSSFNIALTVARAREGEKLFALRKKNDIINSFAEPEARATLYRSGFSGSIAERVMENARRDAEEAEINLIKDEYKTLVKKYSDVKNGVEDKGEGDNPKKTPEEMAESELLDTGYARDSVATAIRRADSEEGEGNLNNNSENKDENNAAKNKSSKSYHMNNLIEAQKLFPELYKKHKELIEPEAEKVKALGGLCIIGTERHESRRIDNQLRGRAGRQGDPGESQFFLSVDDDLMRLFGGERIQALMETLSVDDDMPIEARVLSKSVERAQKKVEGRNFSARKHVLEFDDVMSQMRNTIYKQRSKVLDDEDISSNIKDMITETIKETVTTFCQGDIADNWNLTGLREHLRSFGLTHDGDYEYTVDDLNKISRDDIENDLLERANSIYKEKESEFTPEQMRSIERDVLLKNVDAHWMDHIDAMSDLKQGIYLRTMGGGKDPIVEYRHEAFDMYDEMVAAMREDTVRMILTVRKQTSREQVMKPIETDTAEGGSDNKNNKSNKKGNGPKKATPKKPNQGSKKTSSTIVKTDLEKTKPNDPCPCGSGRKYKKCCGMDG